MNGDLATGAVAIDERIRRPTVLVSTNTAASNHFFHYDAAAEEEDLIIVALFHFHGERLAKWRRKRPAQPTQHAVPAVAAAQHNQSIPPAATPRVRARMAYTAFRAPLCALAHSQSLCVVCRWRRGRRSQSARLFAFSLFPSPALTFASALPAAASRRTAAPSNTHAPRSTFGGDRFAARLGQCAFSLLAHGAIEVSNARTRESINCERKDERRNAAERRDEKEMFGMVCAWSVFVLVRRAANVRVLVARRLSGQLVCRYRLSSVAISSGFFTAETLQLCDFIPKVLLLVTALVK
uniref:Uncharacterized protein n=2 Tax=Plectus sambesii TaxID=2011161 RepID=A0A914XB73_9BILA